MPVPLALTCTALAGGPAPPAAEEVDQLQRSGRLLHFLQQPLPGGRLLLTPRHGLTIDVDALLAVRMKRQARAEERTLSEITRELWIDYLRKYAEE